MLRAIHKKPERISPGSNARYITPSRRFVPRLISGVCILTRSHRAVTKKKKNVARKLRSSRRARFEYFYTRTGTARRRRIKMTNIYGSEFRRPTSAEVVRANYRNLLRLGQTRERLAQLDDSRWCENFGEFFSSF